MKRFTALLTAAALLGSQLRAPAPGPVVLCVMVGVTIAGGVAVVKVFSCKPKYRCVRDPDTGEQSCAEMTRRQAEAAGLECGSTNYPTREACLVVCSNVVKRLRPVTAEPTGKVWLESSTDGIHWVGVVAAWTYDDEPELNYEEPLGNGAKFFRARYQAMP